MEKSSQKKEYVIFVNKDQFKVSEETLTGQQILNKAGRDPNQYDLFLVHGVQSDQIQLNQSVQIKDGLHFNAILKSVPYG